MHGHVPVESPHKRVLIIPGSVDCNRGDQALVWTAIDLIKDAFNGNVDIGLLTEAEDFATSPCSSQTHRRGYAFWPMIIDNPNRVLKSQGASFQHNRFSKLRVMLCAALDFLHYSAVLGLARWPACVKLLLGQAKYKTYRQIRQSDVVVIKGGGFMYAYRSRTYAYYLWYVCYHTLLAQRLGVPVVILPNSFGPFETPLSRRFITRLLKRCALVTTRECLSQQVLDDLIPNQAQPFPDMAFMLKVPQELRLWAQQELESKGVSVTGRAVGITMRPWRFPGHSDPKAAYEAYLNAMAEFVRLVRKLGLQPVLFAHVRGPGAHEMDRTALDACRARLADDPPILIDGDYDCVQMKALYSHLGYMIGTRFHSCIFAMAQSVPTLAIGYQGYKASGIMSDMKLAEFFVDIDGLSAQRLSQCFARLQESEPAFREKCRTYVTQAERQLRALGPMVARAIEKHNPAVGGPTGARPN